MYSEADGYETIPCAKHVLRVVFDWLRRQRRLSPGSVTSVRFCYRLAIVARELTFVLDLCSDATHQLGRKVEHILIGRYGNIGAVQLKMTSMLGKNGSTDGNRGRLARDSALPRSL